MSISTFNFRFLLLNLLFFSFMLAELHADVSATCSKFIELDDMARKRTCYVTHKNISEAFVIAKYGQFSTLNLEQFLRNSLPLKNTRDSIKNNNEHIYVNYAKTKNKLIIDISFDSSSASTQWVFNEDINGTTITYLIYPD